MSATVETTPEETTPTPETGSTDPKAAAGPQRRHRTVRHVAVHGGSAGAVSVAAEVLHVFGPTTLGLGAAGVAAAGAGVVAARKRRKTSRTGSAKASLIRTARRTIKSAAGTRTAAGLRRSKGAAGASGRARTAPHAASRRTAAAGLRGGASRRAAASTRGGRRTRASSGRDSGTLHRRTRKPSVLGGRAGARGSTRRGGSASRPGGGTGASRRNQRLGNKVMRRLTRASRTKAAAATRPAGKHAAPVTRAGKVRRQASVRGRAAARLTRRQAARSWRFAKASAKATRPFLRLRPPKNQPGKPAMRATAKPATTNKPATPPTKKTAAKTAKTSAAAKKTAKKTPARPGPAMTAPGITVKDIMDAANTTSSLSINAVTEAIREHVTGFEPENAIEILGFLSGLDTLFTELGAGLVTVSEKLGSEHPVDASVVDHLQQMGAHALTLADYGTQTSTLFRAAHESELGRLENPRVREEDWDVERNR